MEFLSGGYKIYPRFLPKNQHKGSFNNYVDKMRRGRGQKTSVFVHAHDIKTVHTEGGGSKNGKILST